MDTKTALDFLNAHSPMPPDSQLTQREIDAFDEIRLHFLNDPTPECIQPLLLAFGEWDGFGVYQLVEDVFRAFTSEQMSEPLVNALSSQHSSVVYWACQISSEFPSQLLVGPLKRCLQHSNSGIRLFAAIALESCNASSAINEIRVASQHAESDDERDVFVEIIEGMELKK